MNRRADDPVAVRLSALVDAVRASASSRVGDELLDELRITHTLAGMTYATTFGDRPRLAAWLAEWDAISREVERELAHVADAASHADHRVARGRERRWSHHSTVVRALMARCAEGGW